MPQSCIAYGCLYKAGNVEGITFHSFPKDEDLRQKWIKATKRKDWEPTKYSKICSAHFREEDIDRTSLSCVRIREGAVPAIFPDFPEESQVEDHRKLERRTEEASTSSLEIGHDEEALNSIYIKEEITYDSSDEECSDWPTNIQRTETTEDSADPLLQNEDLASASNECHVDQELLATDLLAVEMPSVDESEEETCGESNASVQGEDTASDLLNGEDDSSVSAPNHDNKKTFQCAYCDKRYSHKSHLKDHIRTHTGEKPFQCEVCDKSFSRKTHYNNHVRTHTGEKPFQCEVCNKRFARKTHFNYHVRTHTGEKPFKCEICEKSFAHKTSLDYHIVAHTGEKRFLCEFCDRGFAQRGHLNEHIRTHTGETPFQCELCQKSFSQKHRLTDHIKTHSGEKPFQCEYCEKRYSHKSHLNDHIRTHTGEKPFQCEYCNKGFSRKTHYSSHVRTHTGEKPYQCEVCYKHFSRRHLLNDHITIHNGE